MPEDWVVFTEPGYREIDLVDYGTNNLKVSTALHLRLQPEQTYESDGIGLRLQLVVLAPRFTKGTTASPSATLSSTSTSCSLSKPG